MNDYGKYLKEIWKYRHNIFIKKEQQQKGIKNTTNKTENITKNK